MRVALACSLLVVTAGAAAAPPKAVTGADVFASSDRARETLGRPLAATLHLFARPRLPSDAVPFDLVAGDTPLPSLKRFFADQNRFPQAPGSPLLGGSRGSVLADATALYVVPTSRGGACFVSERAEVCHRGLLLQGIAWSACSGSDGLTIYGLAGNHVASVEVRWPGGHRTAVLAANVFSVTRPFQATTIGAPPTLGRLVVHYRDGRPPATVELR